MLDAEAAVVSTMRAPAHMRTEWALLNDLTSLLEIAADQVAALRDAPHGLATWPVTADARSSLGMIADTVAALEAVGWHDAATRSTAGLT